MFSSSFNLQAQTFEVDYISIHFGVPIDQVPLRLDGMPSIFPVITQIVPSRGYISSSVCVASRWALAVQYVLYTLVGFTFLLSPLSFDVFRDQALQIYRQSPLIHYCASLAVEFCVWVFVCQLLLRRA